jgi:hypothetical protein
MTQLPEAWQVLVKLLAESDAAWQTPEQVAAALGGDFEETTDVLASLHVAGLLDVWERQEGPVVTLSPWGASVARLKIVERGLDQSPRWGRVGDPTPPLPRARGVSRSIRGASLDAVVDPRPLPNSSDRESGKTAPGPPSLLIGLGSTPWPGASQGEISHCPVCGCRRLPPHAYCLWCDRWGGDRPDSPRPEPILTVKNVAPTTRGLADEQSARAARKAKQRRRMAERVRRAKSPRSGG